MRRREGISTQDGRGIQNRQPVTQSATRHKSRGRQREEEKILSTIRDSLPCKRQSVPRSHGLGGSDTILRRLSVWSWPCGAGIERRRFRDVFPAPIGSHGALGRIRDEAVGTRSLRDISGEKKDGRDAESYMLNCGIRMPWNDACRSGALLRVGVCLTGHPSQ
ncbi:hypothetical protein M441DRAFT_218394 [Trichoderma asperellum CBS 433.97]|uniref:Uncharacterized protein n=1 Tax=Trichoderma asperellum (strain ATCC 204424 / CBS 433.97 / NBRC 101777) TaxID=1042311 RepID=A0A2T3ZNV2_TRIA4|nr:hypothetical protein M441DRAFT_218394 [Trichoderma asperellum CBS 433.97]PTB46491.1 hypothetical protein M441DRAFT_218394 [Trichoderma asperellum CBS 433.97]